MYWCVTTVMNTYFYFYCVGDVREMSGIYDNVT